mgnify:FL=1
MVESSEGKNRIRTAQEFMRKKGLDAIMVAEPPGDQPASLNVYYLSGFYNPFSCWRPDVPIIPADGDPVMVTTALHQEAVQATSWISDLRTYTDKEFTEGSWWKIIGEVVKDRKLATIGVDKNFMPVSAFENIKNVCPRDVKFEDCSDLVIDMQAIKSKKEVDKLRQACRLSERALKVGLESARVGMTEKELSLIIYKSLHDFGLTRRPPPISLSSGKPPGGGKATDKKIESGDIIHFDFGGQYELYACDLTRTAIVKGRPSEEFERVYNIVLDAEQSAVKAVKPGIKASEIDAIAREKMKKAGFTYGHNTGHGLGLHTHYYPVIGPAENRELKPGMCFTIEPNARIPGKAYAHVEDDIVVTETGYESMTSFPREIYRID